MFAWKFKAYALLMLILATVGTVAALPAVAHEHFVVDYRVAAWRTVRFNDPKSADAYVKAVTRLGCEVKSGAKNSGYIDVSFVCPQWHRLELDTHDQAHQWEKWFHANGFETKHSH